MREKSYYEVLKEIERDRDKCNKYERFYMCETCRTSGKRRESRIDQLYDTDQRPSIRHNGSSVEKERRW